MAVIRNPILPGFHPDPSIIRVGEDYYIATSTFEWFPGVRIHHSRDLVHWEPVATPLSRTSQLDLSGVPNSGGVWAPCLSHADGRFWLVYTNCHSFDGWMQDTPNYVVTADRIEGPWSEPVSLNSSGFDPSLFHDVDGRKWLVNMNWDFRPNRNRFAGILLQEYDPKSERLVGPIRSIFAGSPLGVTEGPHLYRRGGWYYLLTAEGGTNWEHAVTVARSRAIEGPYEVDPQNPILTALHTDCVIQKAGHADLVETQQGEWYMVHLGSRPIGPHRRSVLGRETCIQKVAWTEDGWLRLAQGGNRPLEVIDAPQVPNGVQVIPGGVQAIPGGAREIPELAVRQADAAFRDDFDAPRLGIHWSTLRVPFDGRMGSLTECPGHLRLYGMESPVSKHAQSLVARRQQAFRYEASTCVSFRPAWFKQMAGLITLYSTRLFHYLHVTHDDRFGVCLNILSRAGRDVECPLAEPVPVEGWDRVHLRVTVDGAALQFWHGADGVRWEPIGPVLDASILSDEYAFEAGEWAFTGAFTGVCCQDLSGQRLPADFDWFEYREG